MSLLYSLFPDRRQFIGPLASRTARIRRGLCLALLAGLGWMASAQDLPAPPKPSGATSAPAQAHFRVLWLHQPATQALVSWTTPTPGRSHAVHYDTQPRHGRLGTYAHHTAALPSQKYPIVDGDAGTPEGWAQNVHLRQLTPATTYYFVIVSDATVSREFHLITAPADDRPVKLLYGADSRRPPNLPEPHAHRQAINRLIASLVEAQPDILALAHGGDYNTRDEWKFMADWLTDHELTITASGRVLPIIPCRGNHESKNGFEVMFHWPGLKAPYYYATELSRRVTLVTLNTNVSKAGDQRDWLEAELARQRATAGKWLVVQYHVPAFPSVKSFQNGAQQRQHWVPLFEQHQVDLVCEADDHMLKRTVPIFAEKHDPVRGIVYIGDGGAGVPPRAPDLTRWYLQAPGFAKPAHHVHLIEFGAREMRVTAISPEKETLDRFTVQSKSAPVPATR